MPILLRVSSLCVLLGLVLLSSPSATHAQVSDISYTVAPEGTYMLWSDEAGLEDGLSYGGRFGFGFGQFAELSGLYQRGTFTSSITPLATERNLAALANTPNRDVTMSRYGGSLKLNVARGTVIPFLQAGTGILRLAPEGLDENETIYLEGGAGLQFSVANRYTLTLQAQNLAYRYKPAQLFLSAEERALLLSTNPAFNTQNVRNWAFTAGLQFYLGGREPGTYTDLDTALQDQLGEGLQGVRLPIEPFVGRISFADALGFGDGQRIAGLFTGLDLGPYVGLRGFYWRGLAEESLTDFVGIQSYGGELRLRMAADRGTIQPFFTLGGGYLDVLSGYAEETGATDAEDDPYALAGIGFDLPINAGLRFRASARALFLSEQDLDDLSQPQQVSTSFMYTAGLTFSLGRKGRTLGAAIDERLTDMEERALTREERLQVDVLRAQAQLDSLRATLVRQARADSMRQAMLFERLRADSLRLAQMGQMGQPDTLAQRPATTQFMQVPIPEQGEIYIRFGPPGGVRITLPDTLAARQDAVMIKRDVVRQREGDIAAVYADSIAVEADLVPEAVQDVEREQTEDGLLTEDVLIERDLVEAERDMAEAERDLVEAERDMAEAERDMAEADSLLLDADPRMEVEARTLEQRYQDEIDRLNQRIRTLETMQADSLRADTTAAALDRLLWLTLIDGARADSLALLTEQKVQQDLRDEVNRLRLQPQTTENAGSMPDSLQQDRLDALLRQALMAQARRDSLTLVEQRKIQQDLRDEIARLRRDLEDAQQPVPPPPPPPVPPAADNLDDRDDEAPSDEALSTSTTTAGFYYGGLDGFGGFYLGSFRPALGVRAELRLEQADALRFAPEAVLALGGDVLLNLNLNALYDFPTLEGFQPYGGAGLGLVGVDGNYDTTVNLVVGTERAFAAGRFFGEFMTLDFFDRSRVAVGYRLSY